MAEGLALRVFEDAVRVQSAESRPTGVDPLAVEAMAEIRMSALQSQMQDDMVRLERNMAARGLRRSFQSRHQELLRSVAGTREIP
jgi:hypothetical protein